MWYISEPSEADRSILRKILSDADLLRCLYPQVKRPPDIGQAVDEWSDGPAGDEDVQIAVRSAEGSLRGCARLENGRLSYFVDPDHWGSGYGRFMVHWLEENVLRERKGRSFKATVARHNLASIRVLESVGFVFSGISSEHASYQSLLDYTLRT